ncbi:AraC family transcriptional regulator, partial [Phocaeicola vulgatus]|nr:AraC family transcriptional regulator [Phocaeicola vulgatus]
EAFLTERVMCDNGSLYNCIWLQEGKLTLIVVHVEIEMEQDEIISVSILHRTVFKNVSGRYLALLFNENF